jgi:hypothetical protein
MRKQMMKWYYCENAALTKIDVNPNFFTFLRIPSYPTIDGTRLKRYPTVSRSLDVSDFEEFVS